MSSPEKPTLDRNTLLAEERTDLAFERTRFAADRTLMAWLRTSLSMVGFGFSLFKVFQYLQEVTPEGKGFQSFSARNLGLTLVLLGTVMLVLAIAEYIFFQHRLSKEFGKKFPYSTALLASVLITIIGLMALLNLLFKIPYL